MDIDRLRVIAISATSAQSRYRLIDEHGKEIEAVNEFLDATALRGLSERTLRTYAYALLSVWKWLKEACLSIDELTETDLAGYIRHLRERAGSGRPPAPRAINLRLVVLRCLYRFRTNGELPRARNSPLEPIPFRVQASRVGLRESPRAGRPSLRVKTPKRLIVPLRHDEVIRFFESFRTYRDLAIVSLMLFCGLRSREVLSLTLKDVSLLQDELRISGKGDKERVLPLAPYVRNALSSYLRVERPQTSHDIVFVNLKGPRRGSAMTPAGLRGLFRYHRKRSGISKANPHRFRHTFAADMVREGMPLPVLMRLMGHSTIEMTMRYVNLSAEDVREEFERAVRRLTEGFSDGKSLPKNP